MAEKMLLNEDSKWMIVQCATFSKSLNPRNITKSVSDIRIRIRFPFQSTFWISVSGCKLTILPDIKPANRIEIISDGNHSEVQYRGDHGSGFQSRLRRILRFFFGQSLSGQNWLQSWSVLISGTGAESESEKVTLATPGFAGGFSFTAEMSGLWNLKFFSLSPVLIRQNWIQSSPDPQNFCKLSVRYSPDPPMQKNFYFVLWGKRRPGAILPSSKYDWLKEK